MSTLKTQPNQANVTEFINAIDDPVKKKDSKEVLKLMKEITGEKAVMWGSSIIGFGSYHYKYASGREGDWFVAGFSPRKQSLTLYIMGGHKDKELYELLGKHTTGKGCLYIKRLSDIDMDVLKQLITKSVQRVK
ncbi:MAG: hypothetical protein DHS20C17_23560 [Cyclobacteriaceae bacterium]|nr:MAG: hypothetical protein DHS20C17_23560 [Cyclobacteriaceae bacterium]